MPLISDMKLTRNFRTEEFLVSEDFPELAEMLRPTQIHIGNLYLLSAIILQPARDFLNRRHPELEKEIKIIILSGYRDADLNLAVEGWPTSLHMEAKAGDATTDPIEYLPEFYGILLEHFRYAWIQAILYRDRNFAHVALPHWGVPRLCEIR